MVKFKYKGAITIEFTFLLVCLIFMMLTFYSLIVIVSIDERVYNEVEKSAKSVKTTIYLAYKASESSSVLKLVGLGEHKLKKMGVVGDKTNITSALNKNVLGQKIKNDAYKRLKLGLNNNPINRDLEIAVGNKNNSLIVKSYVSVKLPVVSKLIGDVKLRHTHILAARGVKDLFGENNLFKKLVEKGVIVVTKYGVDKTNVYHTTMCMGNTASNKDTNKNYNISDIKKIQNSKREYIIDGVKFRMCKLCMKK